MNHLLRNIVRLCKADILCEKLQPPNCQVFIFVAIAKSGTSDPGVIDVSVQSLSAQIIEIYLDTLYSSFALRRQWLISATVG